MPTWMQDPAETLWAGDEHSLSAASTLVAKINADSGEHMGFEIPSLLSKDGDVGVISINGPLYSSVPDWAKAIFGVIDYPQIAEAIVDAAKDPSIGSIVLDINSPGGAVSGIHAVSDLLNQVKTVKPVFSHADTLMASAAYWLGATAHQVSHGTGAETGSVGVIARHVEHSKAMEQAGLTVTTLRSGPFKQVVNPYEPLTPAAKEDLQGKINYMYGQFLAHVADARGVPMSQADLRFGQGRTFIGQQALDAGLVDAVQTFQQTLDEAQKAATTFLDKRKSLIQNPKKQKEGTDMGRKASLTAEEIAAIAAGALPAEPAAPEATTQPAPAPADPVVDPVATDPAPAAPEATTQPAPAAPAAAPSIDPVVALLTGQLKERDDALVTARVETAKLTADLAAAQVANESFLPIVRQACQNMAVALRLSSDHVAGLSAAALVAEHAALAEKFKKQFPIGGVSATVSEKAGKPQADQLQMARIGATRLNK